MVTFKYHQLARHWLVEILVQVHVPKFVPSWFTLCIFAGVGAMASVDEIVAQLLKVLTNK